MKKLLNTKKMVLATLLSGSILLAGIGTVIAHQNNNMHGNGSGMYAAESQLDEKTIELQKKFRDETTDLRKKMFTTRAEMRALMSSTTPDSKEAGRLAAELFDIKNELHKKAEAAGVDTVGSGQGHKGFGRGMMAGRFGGSTNLYCNGQGPQGRF